MKILVTAGATREPIDAVRFLSNVSTGATGAALSEEFQRHGHGIVHLHGEGAVLPSGVTNRERFSSAADLAARLERRLSVGGFDAVIMAAAIADYRPAQPIEGKLTSDAATRSIELVRNEKILPRLKTFSPRPLSVIGFKLTVGADSEARQAQVTAQFTAGGVDAVVQNDLAEIRRSTVHPFWLWNSATAAPRRLEGVPALARELTELLATFSR